MPPDAGATAVLYGIVKEPTLMDEIRAAGASVREDMLAAIDTLQENPFPDGHEVRSWAGATLIVAHIKVASGNTYTLAYIVDEQKEKILVVRANEKRFSNPEA